jgi:hypothetical protein
MGGAIFNMGADSAYAGSGQATLINCTLTGNTAQGGVGQNPGSGLGGAVFNVDGTVKLVNDTVDTNHADKGGAVYNLAFGKDIPTGGTAAASLILNNNILADSTHPVGNVLVAIPDLVSSAQATNNTATVSGSHNLVMGNTGTIGAGVITLTTSPHLGPLQNNGGLTPTMLPQPGSPVLGAGDPLFAPTIDQRDHTRPLNGPIDLGAVQLSVAPTGRPATPPTLHTPFLLALFDQLLHGVETVNANETETVIDSIFGLPLLMSTYDGVGNLEQVTFLGFNVTALFE